MELPSTGPCAPKWSTSWHLQLGRSLQHLPPHREWGQVRVTSCTLRQGRSHKRERTRRQRHMLPGTWAALIGVRGRSNREAWFRTPVWELGKEHRSLITSQWFLWACSTAWAPATEVVPADQLCCWWCFSSPSTWILWPTAGHAMLGPVWDISWGATSKCLHLKLYLKIKNAFW